MHVFFVLFAVPSPHRVRVLCMGVILQQNRGLLLAGTNLILWSFNATQCTSVLLDHMFLTAAEVLSTVSFHLALRFEKKIDGKS